MYKEKVLFSCLRQGGRGERERDRGNKFSDSHEENLICWYNAQSVSIYDYTSLSVCLSVCSCNKTHMMGRMTFSNMVPPMTFMRTKDTLLGYDCVTNFMIYRVVNKCPGFTVS
jgi:hypothetical protein